MTNNGGSESGAHARKSRVHQVHGEENLRLGRPDLVQARFFLARLEMLKAEREEDNRR